MTLFYWRRDTHCDPTGPFHSTDAAVQSAHAHKNTLVMVGRCHLQPLVDETGQRQWEVDPPSERLVDIRADGAHFSRP